MLIERFKKTRVGECLAKKPWIRKIYRKYLKLKKPCFFAYHRMRAKIQGKTIVHFLHIGKTGGSAIKYALGRGGKALNTPHYIILLHTHGYTLKHTQPREKIFFFVRDPLTRFISGFYSRKRKGLPRLFAPWTPAEEQAFAHFTTPNQLGNALSSSNPTVRQYAEQAMIKIGHVKSSYWDWFIDENLLSQKIGDIIFVGQQESLDSDFVKLKQLLGIPDSYSLPQDEVKMHKNPSNVDKHLDPEAEINLKKWYTAEYQFLDFLETEQKI